MTARDWAELAEIFKQSTMVAQRDGRVVTTVFDSQKVIELMMIKMQSSILVTNQMPEAPPPTGD